MEHHTFFASNENSEKKSEPQIEVEPIVIQLDALTIDHELLGVSMVSKTEIWVVYSSAASHFSITYEE